MSIIFIHELGHFMMGILLKLKVERIELYPYGGCSKFVHDVNIELYKEFLVLIMGPIVQCVFVFLIKYLNIDVPNYFYSYHWFILLFNLLPIYPLDGGRILQVVLSYIIPYYYSFRSTLYFGYCFFLLISAFFLIYSRSLVLFLILGMLFLKLLKEMKLAEYYFQKFLLERYLNDYNFKKVKNVKRIESMKRDYEHCFIVDSSILKEKEYLRKFYYAYPNAINIYSPFSKN